MDKRNLPRQIVRRIKCFTIKLPKLFLLFHYFWIDYFMKSQMTEKKTTLQLNLCQGHNLSYTCYNPVKFMKRTDQGDNFSKVLSVLKHLLLRHTQPAQQITSANFVPLFFNISIYDHKCHQQNWELKLHSEGKIVPVLYLKN